MTILLAGVQERVVNSYQSATGQTPAATTRTYIQGSAITVPDQLKVGSRFRWRFNMTKTAAGVAASTIDIAFGSTGTTTDTARVSFTKPAGTAAVDEGVVEIDAVVLSVSATGVVMGELILTHNGNTAGHATIPDVVVNASSAGFPNDGSGQTVAGAPLVVGLCITTGAADAITINWVQAEYNKP